MADLVHVRLGKGLKKKMEALIQRGLYSNQAEMIREGLREVLRKYEKEFKRK
jgi:Arc/MetJ-type ribon-helix-helix transcriptional regulator